MFFMLCMVLVCGMLSDIFVGVLFIIVLRIRWVDWVIFIWLLQIFWQVVLVYIVMVWLFWLKMCMCVLVVGVFFCVLVGFVINRLFSSSLFRIWQGLCMVLFFQFLQFILVDGDQLCVNVISCLVMCFSGIIFFVVLSLQVVLGMFQIMLVVLFWIRVGVLVLCSFSRLCVLLLFMLVRMVLMVLVLVFLVIEWNSMFIVGLWWLMGGLLLIW